jgi:hypothetical protein
MKAPKGRHVIAWGIAPSKQSLSSQALKGRNIYVALSGLDEQARISSPVALPQAITFRSFGAFLAASIIHHVNHVNPV